MQDDIEQHTSLLRRALYQYETWEESMHQRWSDWLNSYRNVLIEDGTSDADRLEKMKAVNPKFIFRNYLAQLVIDDIESGSTTVLEQLHNVLRDPFSEHQEHEAWAERMPEWARKRAGCSALSCSS